MPVNEKRMSDNEPIAGNIAIKSPDMIYRIIILNLNRKSIII
ncbi:hypothetical protein Cpin_0561 [Chitinophaga pinensis DSM 2588]|uniref:Uncharacterized protein n=1 Tax=Chitinophaga pinensis (strain ATCC 43595 / DSM 2588 / LMG 13176 / NBRC 15968 / NCIMB 11800 / UQM 2034) TaxID=485918 RepID=A0A979FZH2_CHIPD|nr:hypothetical protein Cpin_0561 [Chitinophaga pinensis DSM 2588]